MRNFINDESGQDLIEYALLAGFISLIVVAAVITTGTGLLATYDGVSDLVNPLGGGA
jgi:Flp pilus assembly pilin Flp